MGKVTQEWFKPGQLAKRSGCSRRYISGLVETGQLEASRLSTRTTLISEEAWQAFLNKNKTGRAA